MTNRTKLRNIMTSNRFRYKDVADLLEVKVETVKSWLTPPTSKSARFMPKHRMDTLVSKLR